MPQWFWSISSGNVCIVTSPIVSSIDNMNTKVDRFVISVVLIHLLKVMICSYHAFNS